MPVDLFELSNNHVWQAEFAFRDFGEPPADVHERRARRAGASPSGAGSTSASRTTTPCSTAASGCGRRRGPPRASTRSRWASAGSTSAWTGGLDAAAWLRGLDAGRSFVTTGPMLFVTLDGHDPGHRFDAGRRRAARVPPGRLGDERRAAGPDRGRRQRRGRPDAQARQPQDGPRVVREPDRGGRCRSTARPGSRSAASRTGPTAASGSPTAGRSTSTSPGKPLRPRKAEVEYLIRRVEEQIARSAGVLPARRWTSTARPCGSTARSPRRPADHPEGIMSGQRHTSFASMRHRRPSWRWRSWCVAVAPARRTSSRSRWRASRWRPTSIG